MDKKEVICPNCKKLEAKIEEQEKKLKEQEKAIKQLERRLKRYENAHTPPSCLQETTKPDCNPRKLGRPNSHKGTTRFQAVPSKRVKLRLERCPECNKRLGKPTKIERRVVEEIPEPQPVRVIEYSIAHYHCAYCHKDVSPTHPNLPSLRGRFGVNLLSKVALLKYSERLSHRKIKEMLKRDYGLEITPAAIFEMTNRVANILYSDHKEIIERLRLRNVVNVDETGIKVNGKQYWIWIFTTTKETLVAIRDTRGSDVPKQILGEDFKGLIVADGLRAYFKFTKRLQKCWAHILREAKYIAQTVKEAEKLKDALYRLYHSITYHSPPEEERTKMYRNVIQRLRYWLRKKWSVSAVVKFINKLKSALPYLFTFILNPNVEPTNNRAERALREHVIMRKIIGTLRNEKGTRIYETISSVLATWKQNALNIDDMLRYRLSYGGS